ncbi:HNH endonuclease [Streptomyces sp. NPDC059009]|uniref:HNH endonuclease n=1 Tax=Streptomyces sp. NPDC059009 TaxID=3346694 RepID=UPI0036C8F3D9
MAWSEKTEHAYPPSWPTVRTAVRRRDCGLCQWVREDTGTPCLEPATDVDHIVPLSQSGPSTVANARMLCDWHHKRKTAREAAAGKRAKRNQAAGPRRRKHPGEL